MPHKPKNILVAPLDWGLGHTTRCIPLINHILKVGHNPIFAGNDSQRSFVKETFGDIQSIHLEGYNVRYSAWNRWGQVGLLRQLPRIKRTISAEHKWLQQMAAELALSGVISDNRYGLYAQGLPSVILTHQLQVRSGLGTAADNIIQHFHYKYLNRFDATWVVDSGEGPGLAGKLSHPSKLPRNCKYIGLLSRFEHDAGNIPMGGSAKDPLLILLSGPEPQRSDLSALLWKQALRHRGDVIFIEGSDNVVAPSTIPPHITYHQRLTGAQLEPLLRNAGMVICRSGYSTIMDLAALNKRAVLIPTPGQTEQQYLGKLLHGQGLFYCTEQAGFSIDNALANAQGFPYTAIETRNYPANHKAVPDEWLNRL